MPKTSIVAALWGTLTLVGPAHPARVVVVLSPSRMRTIFLGLMFADEQWNNQLRVLMTSHFRWLIRSPDCWGPSSV